MSLTALCLGLVLSAPPAPGAFAHPAFSLTLVAGEVARKGTDKEGMARVDTEPLSQLVYWTRPTSTLRARADHERRLVARAGKAEGEDVELSGVIELPKLGKGALTWTARVARTVFASTVVDCGSHHVLLTTMGPDAAGVEAQQQQSLGALQCRSAKKRR
jgi:hypothetical protein